MPATDDVGPPPAAARPAVARESVTGLYQVHAVGLTGPAVVMLGDRAAAEAVVQEAFCGLHRRWAELPDAVKARRLTAASWPSPPPGSRAPRRPRPRGPIAGQSVVVARTIGPSRR